MIRWREIADEKLSELRLALEMLTSEREALRQAQQTLAECLEAREVIQTVAAGVQQQVHQRIAAVVTRCLQTVFDDPYEFRIHFDRKRGKTEARMVFVRGGMEIDPTSAAGGSVVDVAALALRVAALLLTRPQPRRLLVLDEPMKFLAREVGPRVRELLEVLSEEFNIQVLMVTHDEDLVCGKVVNVG